MSPAVDRARPMLLWTLALTWLFIAVGIASGRSPVSPNLWHTELWTWVRVIEWSVPAVGVAVTACTGRGARVTIPALVVGPALRIASYLWAWVMWLISGGAPGISGAWYPALIHLPFLALVAVAAVMTGADRGVRDAIAQAGDQHQEDDR